MAERPTKIEYVLGGVCRGSSAAIHPTVEVILRELGALDAYAPQGKLTITLENHPGSVAADGGSTPK